MSVSLERVRFLLVDDNVHMMNIVKTVLRGFGAVHVFEAKNTHEAMERLKHDNIDIMVLDYQLGEDDGLSFIRQLRNDPHSPGPYVPVIMLTAHSERARVTAARDAGVNEFCVKPVTASDMLKKVAAIIDHPRAFIRSDSYFGPERRRHDDPNYRGPERRADRKTPG